MMNYYRFVSVFSLLLIAAVPLAACSRPPAQVSMPTPQITNNPPKKHPATANGSSAMVSERKFAFAIYEKIKTGENFFYSPYSLWAALAMTSAGAGGNTKSQMAEALQFGSDASLVHAEIAEFEQKLSASGIKSSGFTLNIVNGLWAEQSYRFLEPFLSTLKNEYGAGLHLVDFKNDSEVSRQRINDAVLKDTQNKIENLIPQGAVSSLTRLVLTNAIYLKGKWDKPFDKARTIPKDFHSDQGVVKADMMVRSDRFPIYETAEFVAVEMPYVGGKFAMLAILPRDKLGELESTLSDELLQKIANGLREVKIVLAFPKFKIESNSLAVPALKALGMKDAFDASAADFSLMDGTRELSMSNVLHKAFIQVDEEGTEAAAATAIIIEKLAVMIPKEVIFDKPFMSLIWHKETGAVLFMGRVTNPKSN